MNKIFLTGITLIIMSSININAQSRKNDPKFERRKAKKNIPTKSKIKLDNEENPTLKKEILSQENRIIMEAPPEQLIPMNPTSEIVNIETEEANYVGGRIEFEKYLEKNLIFPEKAKNSKVEGKVYVRFVINADGTSKNHYILKYVGFGCDEEAMRLIKIVPKWIPKKQNGKYVESEFTVPIAFKLPL